MSPEISVALERLATLCDRWGIATVATAMGVSRTAASLVRNGKRPPSADFLARLARAYPVAEQEAPSPRRGSSDLKTNPEVAWLSRALATVADCTGVIESHVGALNEIDRLVGHMQYQAMRSCVLGACTHPELRSVLLEPPTSGPAVEISKSLATMRELLPESVERQTSIDPDVQSELYRRHSQFRRSTARVIEKYERRDEPEDLMRTGAWASTETTVCELLKPLPHDRLLVIGALTGSGPFADRLARSLECVRSISFPCTEFQNDPVGFVRTILGEDPWEDPDGTDDDQVTLLESVRDHKRTVGPSARGVGKTKGVGWLSWWRYCCWEDGRVCVSNFTGVQLRTQDWAEILRCLSRSGICLDCRRAGVTARPCPHSQVIDAEPCETPTKGIWSDDKERFIIGITGKEATSLGGYHGIHILVICDEFSGLSYELFNAWKGNIAGPEARFFGPGNCLDSAEHPMWDAVNDEKTRALYGWNVVNLSGEVAARTKLPYLPDAAELKADELSDDRGRENPIYLINNRGLYPKFDELCIYQPQHILRSQDVDNYSATEARGRLVIPIDPAGESGEGDEACAGAVRGFKLLEKRVGRAWTKEDYLDLVIELIERHREHRNEVAIVAVDADGVGHKVVNRLEDYLATTRLAAHEKVLFEVVPVYFGQQAPAKFDFELVGDEAHYHLARWLARGGAVPHDDKLRQEMNHSKWYFVRRRVDGVWYDSIRSATRKDGPEGYRKVLHRSPDRLDMLRVFAYAAYMHHAFPVAEDTTEAEQQDAESQVKAVNPRDAFNTYMRNIKKGRHQ